MDLEISLPRPLAGNADDLALKKKEKENDFRATADLPAWLVKLTALCRIKPSGTTEYPRIHAVSRALPDLGSAYSCIRHSACYAAFGITGTPTQLY